MGLSCPPIGILLGFSSHGHDSLNLFFILVDTLTRVLHTAIYNFNIFCWPASSSPIHISPWLHSLLFSSHLSPMALPFSFCHHLHVHYLSLTLFTWRILYPTLSSIWRLNTTPNHLFTPTHLLSLSVGSPRAQQQPKKLSMEEKNDINNIYMHIALDSHPIEFWEVQFNDLVQRME